MLVSAWLGLSIVLLMGCTDVGRDQAVDSDSPANPWQYPIRLGYSRSTVQELLGPSHYSSKPMRGEFPRSGVSAIFNAAGRVTLLSFGGEANYIQDLYIPSDRPVLFGLSGHSSEEDFRLALGSPVAERQEGAGPQVQKKDGRYRTVRGVRLVWKKEGYIVEGLFVAEERGHRGNIYDKGTLSSFDVHRGL